MRHSIDAVAVVSVVDPCPPDSGKKAVLMGFLDHLTDRVGAANVHYLLVGGRTTGSGRDFPVRLHELSGPTSVQRLASVVSHAGTGRASLQEAMVRSPTTARAIARVLRELAVGLELYDTVRLAQYAAAADAARQVCYLDDLFSERYRLMLAAMRRHPHVDLQPLGAFAGHVPAALRPLATLPAIQRTLLTVEQRLVQRSEDRAAHRFDTCLLVNPDEVELLRSRTGLGVDRVLPVPPLVSGPRSSERDYRGAPEFVFLGLLSLPHNDDGLRNFLLEVWPEVLRRRPDARLRVVGREPRKELRGLATRYSGSVVLDGYVPDLDAVLTGAAAMINPLRFGTGIKIKVIEALRRGLPVVSSPIGAAGMAHGPETGIFLAPDVRSTVEAVLRLTDPQVNHRASEAAEAHFARHYSREAAFACYDRAFGFTN